MEESGNASVRSFVPWFALVLVIFMIGFEPLAAGPAGQSSARPSITITYAACDSLTARVEAPRPPVFIEVHLNGIWFRSDAVGGGPYAVNSWPSVALLPEGSNEYRLVLHDGPDGDAAVAEVREGSFGCGTGYPGPELSAPAPPADLVATALADGRVELVWSDRSNNESGFGLYYEGTTLRRVTAGITRATIDGLPSAHYACFAVYAMNAEGSSAFSNWSCVTTAGQDTDFVEPSTTTVEAPETPSPTATRTPTSTPSPSTEPSPTEAAAPITPDATEIEQSTVEPPPTTSDIAEPTPIPTATAVPPAIQPFPCRMGTLFRNQSFAETRSELARLDAALTETKGLLADATSAEVSLSTADLAIVLRIRRQLDALGEQLQEIDDLLANEPCNVDELAERMARAEDALDQALALLGDNNAGWGTIPSALAELQRLLDELRDRLDADQGQVMTYFFQNLAIELLVALVLMGLGIVIGRIRS